MNIVMHCSGMPFNGNTINEKSLGGSETAAYYIAKELAAKGHGVTLFTNHPDGGVWDGVNYVYVGEISESTPLGATFEFYARNTPHDMLIIQRHPQAFIKPYASKVNIVWLHDLALYRSKDIFLSQMWNVDAVLTVSEYHKQQVCDVYNLKPEIVFPVLNGVDLDLFDFSKGDKPSKKLSDLVKELKGEGKKLLTYSSRPERGLNNLVFKDGIMSRLLEECPEAHLVVCGYDNTTPHMAEFYHALWQKCDELPNVTNVGALTKRDLAYLMSEATLHTYPTEFEEVSCITAMECAMAKLPFISSAHAALPETCEGSGSVLLDLKGGKIDQEAFAGVVSDVLGDADRLDMLVDKQDHVNSKYTWKHAADVFNNTVTEVVEQLANASSDEAVAKHLMSMSDIRHLCEMSLDVGTGKSNILKGLSGELNECYQFYFNSTFVNHYRRYYDYEQQRGVNYGPENLDGNLRFEYVSSLIADIADGSTVLDYGCAHGHYTINLAKRFPKLSFVGVDIEASNILKAEKWAKDEDASNVKFIHGEAGKTDFCKADVLIAAEVLEHVGDVDQFLLNLLSHLKVGGKAIFTTPYGPWEAQGYLQHWPWRAHLYEFSKGDIKHIFQAFTDLDIKCVTNSLDRCGNPLGSYVFTFTRQRNEIALMPYEKKGLIIPRKQTLSLCMIVKDAEADIERCLKSALPICDEVVVGIDETTTDFTGERIEALAAKYHIPCTVFFNKSPIEIGFDEARNATIEKASGDWILWLDSDEELHNAEGLLPYLRNSQYDGIALKQHHITAVPAGILKTDIPCKIFRNRKGIKFYGVVHEHPELEYGKGIEYTCGVNHAVIMHYGYPDEPVRRGRFERNLALLGRDREKYPDRTLGKLLWLRDLAQMNKFQMEAGIMNDQLIKRSEEGIALWREILDENLKMASDGLSFYSDCVRLTGNGFEYRMSIDTSKDTIEVQPELKTIRFFSEEHAQSFQTKLLHEKVSNYESRYY